MKVNIFTSSIIKVRFPHGFSINSKKQIELVALTFSTMQMYIEWILSPTTSFKEKFTKILKNSLNSGN